MNVSLQTLELANLPEYVPAESVTLGEAAELAIVHGPRGPASAAVLRRLATRGSLPLGPDGPAMKLPTVRVGNTLRTMRPWLERYARESVRLAAKASPRHASGRGPSEESEARML